MMEDLASVGETESLRLIEAGLGVIASVPEIRIDYLKIVDPDTLEDTAGVRNGALMVIAAWVGSTRLIDNIVVPPR